MTTLSSMMALQVVTMKTYSAAGYDKVGIMITLPVQLIATV